MPTSKQQAWSIVSGLALTVSASYTRSRNFSGSLIVASQMYQTRVTALEMVTQKKARWLFVRIWYGALFVDVLPQL